MSPLAWGGAGRGPARNEGAGKRTVEKGRARRSARFARSSHHPLAVYHGQDKTRLTRGGEGTSSGPFPRPSISLSGTLPARAGPPTKFRSLTSWAVETDE